MNRIVQATSASRLTTVLTVLALSVGSLLLSARHLDRVPLFLTQDEVFFGVTAHSLASTARDTNGLLLPLYFQWAPGLSFSVFFPPALIYVTAIFLKILPL